MAAERGIGWDEMSVLYRRDLFLQEGGFEDSFFMYFEDVDLCLRLGRKGWQTWLEPAAVVVHEESASSDAILKGVAWDWNKARFLQRWSRDGSSQEPVVVAGTTDLLEAEIRFLERAGDVYEERVARLSGQLADLRYESERRRVDLFGTLQALQHEQAHGAWLRGRLDAEHEYAVGLAAELAALRSSSPYRQLAAMRRWLAGPLRLVRSRGSS